MAGKELAIGIVLGAVVSSSFRSSFDTSKKSIAQLHTKISELNAQKLKLKSENMTTEAVAKLNTLRRQIADLKKEAIIKLKLDGLKEQMYDQKESLLALGATGYGLNQPLQARADVEKSQGQLASLGISEKGIENLTKAAEEYVKHYAGTAVPEFISASYDLKSGIASLTDDSLAYYATLSAKTAAATKSSTGTMNKVVALGYGVFRSQFKSDDEFITKFTAASARAVQAFRTDGEDLALGLSNVGASASSMNVSLEEQLAILGVAKTSFNTMAEAGTGYRAFLANVGAAQKDLGLKFVDANGHMLPMVQILQKIKDKYGDLSKLENSDDLKKAFGSDEAVKFIKGLIDRQDELIQSQKDINAEMGKGTELVDEMANAMQRGQGFELMSNNIAVLSQTIGKIFMPAATLAAGVIGTLADGLGSLIESFPITSSVIGGTVMAVFGFAAMMKIATLAQLIFKFGLVSIRGSLLKNITFKGMATAATWLYSTALKAGRFSLMLFGGAARFAGRAIIWMGRALLMNPIGLAITAIAGGAYLIYKYWGPIKSFFADIINSIGKWFNNLFGWFDRKIQSVGAVIKKVKGLFGSDEKPISSAPVRPVAISSGLTKIPASTRTILENQAANKKQRIASVPSRSATAGCNVTINIANPRFDSKEQAAATQKQIKDEVRRAMRDIKNDKNDRGYST